MGLSYECVRQPLRRIILSESKGAYSAIDPTAFCQLYVRGNMNNF